MSEEAELEKLRKENIALQNKLSAYHDQIYHLKMTYIQIEKTLNKEVENKGYWRAQYKALKESIVKTPDEATRYAIALLDHKENDKLKKTIERLEADIEYWRGLQSETAGTVRGLENEMHDLVGKQNRDIFLLNKAGTVQGDMIKALEAKVITLISEHDQALNSLKEKHGHELKLANDELKEENAYLKKWNDEYLSRNNELDEEIDSVTGAAWKGVKEWGKEVEDLKKKHGHELRTVNNKLKTADDWNKGLEEKVKELTDRQERHEEEKKYIEDQILNIIDTLDDLRTYRDE